MVQNHQCMEASNPINILNWKKEDLLLKFDCGMRVIICLELN